MSQNGLKNHVAAEATIAMEIFDEFETLSAIQPQWDDFIENVDGGIFLSYDWCRLWWKYYGQNRDLKIFLFWHQNELVGLIPLFFETVWLGPVHIRAAKIVGTDFTISQICFPVQSVFLQAVMEKFFNELCVNFKWDIICLGTLAGHYRELDTLTAICCRLMQPRWHVEKSESGVQTYFELADTWEEYLSELTNKQRDEFSRNYSLLLKSTGYTADQIVLRLAERRNIDEIFSNFVKMHQIQWKEIGKLGHFGDWPDSEKFHSEIAQAQLGHGRLRLMEISCENDCLGYEYSFKYSNKYFNFLGARHVSEQLSHIKFGKNHFRRDGQKGHSRKGKLY